MRFLKIAALAVAAGSSLAFAVAGQPGTLDATWSGDGKVFVPVSSQPTLPGNDVFGASARQPDGKILLSGTCKGPGASTADQGCLLRLNSDGSVDSSFNTTGYVHGTIAGITVRGEALLLQPDGRIVLSGGCGFSFCAARFLGNGALDTTFGANGIRQVSFSGVVAGFSGAAQQSDGRMVFGGYCSATDFCAIRLTRDGNLDPTFGTGSGYRVHNLTAGNEFIRHLAVDSDGVITAAGQCNSLACVVRLTATGALDASFNGNGLRTGACAASTDFYGFARQPDGRYLVAGTALVSGQVSACMTRLNADGSTDNSFASGLLTTRFGGTNTQVRDLVLQPDGRVILIAKCGVDDESICARRYHTDGALDLSFAVANGNLIRTEMTVDQTMLNLVRGLLDGDGKLLVAASCRTNGINEDFCVARYDGGPFAARQCSADIDGDGRVLATVDGLLLARAAAGVNYDALVNGIQFPPNARRTTWTAIRDYLSVHCGVPY